MISAGQSDAGMEFIAKHADYNFVFGMGFNTPTACATTVERLQKASASSGRTVATYGLFMIITGETDAEAKAKWDLYKAGADHEALKWLTQQSSADTKSGADTNVRHMSSEVSNVNLNIGLLCGSYASVARMMDELATVPGPGRRLADLRRVRDRHGDLRPAHPAADEEPPARRPDGEGRRMTDPKPVSYFPIDDPAARCLPARPEPIMLRPSETALIIVDMQNAYASPGGYLDLAGFDISGAAPAIEKIKEAADAARAAGMPVIFFQNGWDPDYVEAGGPGSPNWHKSNALKTMRAQARAAGQAAGQGRLGLRAGAGAAAAARRHRRREAALQRLLQHQPRQPAARRGHPLAGLHRHRDQRVRRVAPCATASSSNISASCCTTPRIMPGPDFIQKATLFNVENFFGWVSSVDEFRTALQANINPMAR